MRGVPFLCISGNVWKHQTKTQTRNKYITMYESCVVIIQMWFPHVLRVVHMIHVVCNNMYVLQSIYDVLTGKRPMFKTYTTCHTRCTHALGVLTFSFCVYVIYYLLMYVLYLSWDRDVTLVIITPIKSGRCTLPLLHTVYVLWNYFDRLLLLRMLYRCILCR